MRLTCALVMTVSCGVAAAAEPVVLDLWPDKPPGYQVTGGTERDTSGPDAGRVADRPVIRLGDVSKPQIHIYRPAEGKANGTAVVVCPGGGFNILAWDLEGTEVAEWLNSIGVTAAVLKYRTPTGKADPSWLPPTQDAQRAVRLVRGKADDWKLDPKRIGVLGFSAGGKTAAMTALKGNERLYEAIDGFDENPGRPDFAVLIYPAYLVDDDGKLRPEVVVTKDAPPTFLAHAFDDPVTPMNSVGLFAALKAANVRSELHVYAAGGHGYGLRLVGELPVTTWPQRCADWLGSQGLLGTK